MSKRKILVLGGTGAIGTHLVDLLSARGYSVAVTSRSKAGITERVRYLKGNAHDSRFINPILTSENWFAIIDFMVYLPSAFEARVQSFLEVTDQYVFLSSSRVYANSCTPLTEDSPRLLDVITDQTYLNTDEYALSKARQENILFSSSQSNWTIIRPYITFSTERLQLGVLEKEEWLFRALHGRRIIFSKDINARYTTLTYGEDVAKGILAIIGQHDAFGEAFNIVNTKSLRWSEVLETYLDTIQAHQMVRPKVYLVDLKSFVNVHPAKYQILYDRLYNRVFESKKINQFIDTSNFKDPLLSLQMCLNNFLDNPKFKFISAQFEALKDRLTHERTPLHQFPALKQRLRYTITRFIGNQLTKG